MSRLQLAIDVADLDEAIAFYSQMFSVEPTKVRPGYANFAIDEPPLKLVPVSYTHLPSPRDLSTSRMPSSA